MKIVALGDLTFRKEAFHSANLRVMIPPGRKDFAICMVVTLYITGGMKDYGVMNIQANDTIYMYKELLRSLGKKLTRGQVSQLLSDKLAELSQAQTMMSKTAKPPRPDAGTGETPAQKMGPVGGPIPEGTEINPSTGQPYEGGPAKP